jgi:hypothetical protein
MPGSGSRVSTGSSYAEPSIDYRRPVPHSPLGVIEILVAAALAAIGLPLAFLAALAVAARRSRRGPGVSLRLRRSVALLGGLSLGSLALIAMDRPELWLPLGAAVILLTVGEWSSGRRDTAGWLVGGAAAPWSLAWAAFDGSSIAGLDLAGRLQVWLAFAVSTVIALAGVAVAARASARRPAASRPFRSFRTIGVALREPSRVGPFSLPDVTAVVAVGITAVTAPLVGAALGAGWWIGTIATVVLGAAFAAEAYMRALEPGSRRAMEAFLWLGQEAYDSARATTGDGLPSTRAGAAAWLRRHPEREDDPAALGARRVEALLLAGRVPQARAAAAGLPDASPEDRFSRVAALDLVDWWTGGSGDVPTMIEAAHAIEPRDGVAGLRARVALAAAQVRHRAGTPSAAAPAGGQNEGLGHPDHLDHGLHLDPLAPLLAVRDELGALADGRLRRQLWPRTFTAFLVAGLVLTALCTASGQLL